MIDTIYFNDDSTSTWDDKETQLKNWSKTIKRENIINIVMTRRTITVFYWIEN